MADLTAAEIDALYAHAQRAAEEGVAAALEEAATTVKFAREDAASKIAEKERAFKTTLVLRAWKARAAFEAGPRRATLGRDCLRAWAAAAREASTTKARKRAAKKKRPARVDGF